VWDNDRLVGQADGTAELTWICSSQGFSVWILKLPITVKEPVAAVIACDIYLLFRGKPCNLCGHIPDFPAGVARPLFFAYVLFKKSRPNDGLLKIRD
jgi:hypothetical protein